MNHIMFKCKVAQFVWAFIKEIIGWTNSPTLLEDFSFNWLGENLISRNNLIMFGL
jgi:hypothetical protein